MDAVPAKTHVRQFFEEEQGLIIALSHDKVFNKTLEATVMRHSRSLLRSLRFCTDTREALACLKDNQGRRVILFAERQLFHKLTAEFISMVSELYDNVYTIVITDEVEMDGLVFLHETGANNVITRPASMQSLLEKIANTLRPQGKLIRLIENGKRLLRARRFERALETALAALSLKPGSAAALMIKGDALYRLNRVNEAEAAFEEAHRTAKLYLEPMKRLADLHERMGRHDQALEHLRKLDRLSPLSAERKHRIARLYLKLGDAAEAERYFDKAVECAAAEARTMIENLRANIAGEAFKQAPELAAKHLKDLLESKKESLSPSDLEIFNRLGLALRRQGKWEEAVRWYAKALEIAPFDSGVYYNMGMALAEGDKPMDALFAIENALKLVPEFCDGSENVCYNIARIYGKAERPEKAREFLRKALGLNPRHKQARALLAKLDGTGKAVVQTTNGPVAFRRPATFGGIGGKIGGGAAGSRRPGGAPTRSRTRP